MTLSKLKPLSFIILGIIILVFVIIVTSLLLQNNSKPEEKDNSDTTQDKKSLQLAQPKNFDSELNQIDEILPLEGPNYKVGYNKTLNLLMGEINTTSNEDYLKTKRQVEETIKARGVKDICALNIFWVAKGSPEVRQTINPQDTITTSCPVVPSKK